MFFNIPGEDVLRQVREAAEYAHGPEAKKARIIIVDDEGVVTIDDPSLVKEVSVTDGWPPTEELAKISVHHPLIGWMSILQHPDYAQPDCAEPDQSTTTENENP